MVFSIQKKGRKNEWGSEQTADSSGSFVSSDSQREAKWKAAFYRIINNGQKFIIISFLLFFGEVGEKRALF